MSSVIPWCLPSAVEIAELLSLEFLVGEQIETLTVGLPTHDIYDRRIVQGDSHAIARLSTCGRYAYRVCRPRRERYVALATARFHYLANFLEAQAQADQDEEDYQSWRAYGELIREYNGDSD
jgi:hypothetical protein